MWDPSTGTSLRKYRATSGAYSNCSSGDGGGGVGVGGCGGLSSSGSDVSESLAEHSMCLVADQFVLAASANRPAIFVWALEHKVHFFSYLHSHS